MSSMASPPVFHDEFKELPSWPTIIGVISCVWGGITLLYNGCCQLGGSLVGKAFMGAMPPEFQDQMKAQIIGVFDGQMDVFSTSARVLDDGVIDPRDTRAVLANVLAVCREGDARQPQRMQFSVARP